MESFLSKITTTQIWVIILGFPVIVLIIIFAVRKYKVKIEIGTIKIDPEDEMEDNK